MASIIHMTTDGRITIDKCMVGRYEKQDIWKENGGKYNRSGCRLVHFFYHGWFINGNADLHCYTRTDLKKYVEQHYEELLKAYHSMSDKAAEIAIRHAKDNNKVARFHNGFCHA